MPLRCPDNSVMLSASFRNQCPDASEIRTYANSIIHTLDKFGIYVSTRSACSCSKNTYSHVLKSIGLSDELIDGTIRFSLSTFNTNKDIKYTVSTLKAILDNHK